MRNVLEREERFRGTFSHSGAYRSVPFPVSLKTGTGNGNAGRPGIPKARCPVCHQSRLHRLTDETCACSACGSTIPSDALLAAKDRELQAKRSALGIGGSR